MGLAGLVGAVFRRGGTDNAEHLEYLASYIGGRLRREVIRGTSSVRNRSQLSRLPAWVKSAKNREQLLKAIERLRCEKL